MSKKGLPPTIWQRSRQTLGRSFRETGQALDRLGVKTASLAVTKHNYYDDPVIYEDHLSRHRHQFPLLWSGRPLVHKDVAYLAPCSTLIGSVHVGKGSSIWYGAILRADECANSDSFYNNNKSKENDEGNGDNDDEAWELNDDRYSDRIDHHGGGIFIGDNTNIQDNCIVTSRQNHCRIGDGVTVGHLAQIHSATVEDYCLIGMGAIIKENAVIEAESFVGAGCVVESGQIVKSGELWVGNPGRKLRDLSQDERKRLHYQSSAYVDVATGQHGVMALGGNCTQDMLEEAAAAAKAAAAEEEEEDDEEQKQQQEEKKDLNEEAAVDGQPPLKVL